MRTAAVVVAALVLCFLGWRGYQSDEPQGTDPLSAGDPASFAGVAAGVQRQLEVYGALAETTVSHSQAHAYAPKMQGAEASLLELRGRALALGTTEAQQLAALVEFVHSRGAVVRDEAARDHLGMTGIEGLNAFGKEVSRRAELMAAATTAAELGAAIAAPWPPPEDEGRNAALG